MIRFTSQRPPTADGIWRQANDGTATSALWQYIWSKVDRHWGNGGYGPERLRQLAAACNYLANEIEQGRIEITHE